VKRNQQCPAWPDHYLLARLLWHTAANAQAGAPPAAPQDRDASTAGEPRSGSAQVPTADAICRALEQSAAENALPVEFFARVIWQESRFDAQAVSPKGAAGIAQFIPATASWHGLADPFDPVESLRHSAASLRELLNQFGNLGLAAAAYNAGPARVSPWLTSHRPLPSETRNYVALVTGWTADEWVSSSPPEKADTTIPRGVPCTRLANLILAPKQERERIAAYMPRWGIHIAAHLSENMAWTVYRERVKRFASLIGDREPIVLHKAIPGMGSAERYIITIADDDRASLDKICRKLIASDVSCDVMRNPTFVGNERHSREQAGALGRQTR
jgi:Transglycosylase SLT domain